MSLEIVAYIFGIIGAIATVWNLYYAWKHDRLNKFLPSSPEIDEIEKQSIPGEEKERKVKEIISEKISNIDDLKLAFRSAKKMCFAKSYDEALVGIVNKAVQLKEFEFALEVAAKIHFALALDEMLMIIVEKALECGDFGIAEIASDKFHFAKGMDEAKKKIVNAINISAEPAAARDAQ